MTEETSQRRPCHETIVDAIGRVLHLDELENLGKWLKETDIPAGHDAIIAAWERQRWNLGLCVNDEIVADLREQKEEAAAKEAVSS